MIGTIRSAAWGRIGSSTPRQRPSLVIGGGTYDRRSATATERWVSTETATIMETLPLRYPHHSDNFVVWATPLSWTRSTGCAGVLRVPLKVVTFGFVVGAAAVLTAI